MRKQAGSTERLAEAATAEGDEMRKQAAATERYVAVSEEARRSAAMPWLATGSSETEAVTLLIDGIQTDTPGGAFIMTRADGYIGCGLELFNIGNGLALIDPKEVWVLSSARCSQPTRVRWPGRADWPCVGVSRSVQFFFKVPVTAHEWADLTLGDFTGHADGHACGEFVVEIVYTDAAGGQPVQVYVDVFQDMPAGASPPPLTATGWVVGAISYCHIGDETPFARVEIALPETTLGFA